VPARSRPWGLALPARGLQGTWACRRRWRGRRGSSGAPRRRARRRASSLPVRQESGESASGEARGLEDGLESIVGRRGGRPWDGVEDEEEGERLQWKHRSAALPRTCPKAGRWQPQASTSRASTGTGAAPGPEGPPGRGSPRGGGAPLGGGTQPRGEQAQARQQAPGQRRHPWAC